MTSRSATFKAAAMPLREPSAEKCRPPRPEGRVVGKHHIICGKSLPPPPTRPVRGKGGRAQCDGDGDGEEDEAGTAAGFFAPLSMIDWPEKMAPHLGRLCKTALSKASRRKKRHTPSGLPYGEVAGRATGVNQELRYLLNLHDAILGSVISYCIGTHRAAY